MLLILLSYGRLLVLAHFRHDNKMKETKVSCKVVPNLAEYFVKSYLDNIFKIQSIAFYDEGFERSVNKLLLYRCLKYS